MTAGPLTNIIIGIIIFGLATAVIGGTYVAWSNEYNITPDATLQESFNKMNETNALSAQIKDELEGSSVTTETGAFSGVTGAAKGLKLVMRLPWTIIKTLSVVITLKLGIPPLFQAAFIAIVLVVILMAVLSAYMRQAL